MSKTTEEFPEEPNNCALRAICRISGARHHVVSRMLRSRDRSYGQPTKNVSIIRCLNSLGCHPVRMRHQGRTIRTCVRHLSGTHLIFVANHCCAVVDGVLYDDDNSDLARIEEVFRIYYA